MSNETSPSISWDCGSAYDLFASLYVLHHAERFGLRPSWAAGVRSRLPGPERKFLEGSQNLFPLPALWVLDLPQPKDAAAALSALEALPAAQRLPALSWSDETPAEARTLLQAVAERRQVLPGELERLRTLLPHPTGAPERNLAALLDWWTRPAEFGEQMLAALHAYQSVFFAEEEARIRPALQIALEQAQERATRLKLPDLVEQLSHGVHFPALESASQAVLAPSYWITPLVYHGKAADGRLLLVFGARPDDDSLVPGEALPATLLSALKSLADPTRLRVLRSLAGEELTLSQLSRRLRLRMPTMVHHLNTLRLAGLVHLRLLENGERRYTLRREAIAAAFQALERFLDSQDEP